MCYNYIRNIEPSLQGVEYRSAFVCRRGGCVSVRINNENKTGNENFMNISDIRIDSGKSFDRGRVSAEYARFRDIYPDEFYDRIIQRGLCVKGQRVLDVGTGTGVLPRNMYKYGAEWTAADLSENQIEQAKLMSDGMDIKPRLPKILIFRRLHLTL